MKKIFTKLMLLAVAATALASCANDDTNDVTTLGGIDVTINASIEETRSHFGDYNTTDKTYPTLWDGNEDWYVAINGGYAKANIVDGELTYNDDKTGATVNMEIKNVGTTSPYTLYALSPATAFTSYAANNYYRLKIGNSQTPSATSCDPAAQILIAQSEPQEDATSFNVTFKHATAYAKFSFVNLNLEGAIVNNVSVESEVPFAGTFDYKFADKGLVANTASNTITLNTTATENLWFACAPVDLSGKKLTFTISTSNGPLTKEVTMAEGRKFQPGVVATFNINMEGIEFDKSVKYELVTDASELAVGDEIIIAAASANYAISTNQKTSNRGATTITKKDNTIVDPNDAVQIITVEAGTKANTFAFNVGDGKYLYASSSSSNQLKTTSTKNDNASWAITIADGKATIVAQGTFTRNNMRYNPNNNDPLFACYAEGSTTGTLTSIYKLPNTKPAIVASNIEVDEFGVENETASYDVKNMEDDVTVQSVSADWVTASASEKTIKYSVESNYDGETRTAQIVLASASAGISKTITVSQAADVFEVSATEISLGADTDATATFTVKSSYEYSVSNPDSSKLRVVKGDNGVITVTALNANELAEELSIGNIVVSRSVDTKTLKVAVSQKVAEPEQPGGGETESKTYTENFTTWTNNKTTNSTTGTTAGNACSWSWVGASKQYWSNVSGSSSLTNAITLLKPGAADGTYVLSEVLDGGIKSLTVTAISNNSGTGVNVYVIDVATGTTHKLGTVNTTTKKKDFTGTWDLSSKGITGKYQIKIANMSTDAYCCIGGVVWSN